MPETTPTANQPSQQPPFGSSPATGPTPNKGYEAAALQRLGLVVKQLEELVPMAGASSDVGRAVLEALNKLVKLVPAGSVTPAAEKNQIESMQMKANQNNQQMQALQQARQQPQGQPGGGQQPQMQAA